MADESRFVYLTVTRFPFIDTEEQIVTLTIPKSRVDTLGEKLTQNLEVLSVMIGERYFPRRSGVHETADLLARSAVTFAKEIPLIGGEAEASIHYEGLRALVIKR